MAAKRKAAVKKPKPAAQPTVSTTVSTTSLSFGCIDGVCVATDPYPLHVGGAGSQVYMCALNTDIEIKFKGNSPFVSGSKNFSIAKGTCSLPEIVATATPGTKFKFTLKCLAGCPTPALPPEMIVP